MAIAAIIRRHRPRYVFGYIPTDSPEQVWKDALQPAGAVAFVLVGHTHDQFTRQIHDTLLVNPGSIGLPKDGDPRAAFAVVNGGRVDLQRVPYDTERAGRLEHLEIPVDHRRRLAHLIRHAELP